MVSRKSAIQSVVFERRPNNFSDNSKKRGKLWNINTSKRKFKQMGFKLLRGKKVDIVREKIQKRSKGSSSKESSSKKNTGNILQYRFRVESPRKFKRFITKTTSQNINFIIGFE